MAAEVETAVYGGDKPAWHGLGTVVPEDVLTSQEAIELSGLDWGVELVPVYSQWGWEHISEGLSPKMVAVDGRFGVQRQTDGRVLGVVGERYAPLTNAEAFSFVDNIVDDGSAKYHTAGSLRGGRVVWLLAKLNKDILIKGEETERIETYLLFSNSFDGSKAITVAITPIRVVCQNTLNLALSRTVNQWKARHSKGSVDKFREARETLGLTFRYVQEFQDLAETLVDTKMSRHDWQRLMDNLLPLPETEDPGKDRSFKSKEKARDTLNELWLHSPNLQNVQGTAWAAVNAVGAYNDWNVGIRNSRNATPEENRFLRTQDSTLRDRALAFVTDQFVGVN